MTRKLVIKCDRCGHREEITADEISSDVWMKAAKVWCFFDPGATVPETKCFDGDGVLDVCGDCMKEFIGE